MRVRCFGPVRLRGPYHSVQLFEGGRRLLLGQLHTTNDDHALAAVVLEPQLELSLDFGDSRNLRVVHKRFAGRRAGRRLAGGAELEALDDLRVTPGFVKTPSPRPRPNSLKIEKEATHDLV